MTAIAGLAALPAAAQAGGMDHDTPVSVGGGTLPAGWSARTDRNAPLTSVKFVPMGQAWHFTMGVAAVVYRDADKASGNYHTVAKFTQTKPTGMGHGEGMGLIIGGSDLQGEKQQYTYFLVREDGSFLVKRRTGATTAAVTEGTQGWVTNDAVNKTDAGGKMTNELAIGVQGGKVSFTVNGKEVYNTDASKIDVNGNVGMRVNHMLDVHVEGFAIHKM